MEITLTMVLWAIGAAVFFGITSAITYKLGNNAGYNEGLEKGAKAKFSKIHGNNFRITWDKEHK